MKIMNKMGACAFALTLALSLTSCGGDQPNASVEFWVRSNCEMCEETIETALKETPGVAAADLNIDNHMVTVDYDSTKAKVEDFHKACAAAGYDTKLMTANPSSYASLPKCCKKDEDM